MKILWIILGSAAVIVGLVAVLMFMPLGQKVAPVEDTQTSAESPASSDETKPDGRYADYATSAVTVAGYDETIIFFHAPWCPECRAFDQAIKASQISDGVQVLKIDYDTSTDLRTKYGVTLQSTFVKVNMNGDLISRWSGYGKDKSVNAILENT